MSGKYKRGDEVLIKATIKRFNHEANDYAMEGWHRSMECTPPELIVGLASEYEQKRETEWVDVKERLPKATRFVLCQLDCPERFWWQRPMTVALFTAAQKFFESHGPSKEIANVVSWMELPSHYTQTFHYLNCKSCQHSLVCRFVHNGILIDIDKHCVGDHYMPKGE